MRGIAVDEEVMDRVIRAVNVSRKLLPQWQSLARTISRRPRLIVKLDPSSSMTDGKTVWIKVPIELGDLRDHDTTLCGVRESETSVLMCEACALLDEVQISVFHEIGHLLAGSFDKLDPTEVEAMTTEAVYTVYGDAKPGSRGEKIMDRIAKRTTKDARYTDGSVKLASLVSPYLPMMLNCIEDAWVNAWMMNERPGLTPMFAAHLHRVFTKGITGIDGSVQMWSERHPDAQAAIGLFLKGSKIDYSTWLSEQVVEDLNDAELDEIMSNLPAATVAKERFTIAIFCLDALRRKGYFVDPDDSDEESGGSGEESDGEGDGEGEAGTGGGTTSGGTESTGRKADEDGSSAGEPSDAPPADFGDDSDSKPSGGKSDDGDEDEADDDASGSGDGEEDDDDDDSDESEPSDLDKHIEEVAKDLEEFGGHAEDSESDSPEEDDMETKEATQQVLEQTDHYDKPSRSIGGLTVVTPNDRAFPSGYDSDPGLYTVPASILGESLVKMRVFLADNRAGRAETGLRHGRRIDAKVLARKIADGDASFFTKRSFPATKDYFVVLGVDVSGSTCGRLRSGEPILRTMKQAVYAQAELLAKLGIRFAIYAHSGSYTGVSIYEVKKPNDPWNAHTKEALFRLDSVSANLDGHTLEFYRKVAEADKASDRIIMYYTDGAMPCENYDEELAILQENIKICKQIGVTLMGVGVGNDEPTKYGLPTVRLDGIEDVPKVVRFLGDHLRD